MDTREEERPCLHVSLLPGADVSLYRSVQIGAEEEGVPCRQTDAADGDVVAVAYAAAQSSRFGIGVALSEAMAVLHERHMPSGSPVMAVAFEARPGPVCRLIGANAARLVIRKPFRFIGDEEAEARRLQEVHSAGRPAAGSAPAQPHAHPVPVGAAAVDLPVDAALIARIAARVLLKLQERGIQ